MSRLVNYSWPGNIRELQNIIERAVVLSRGDELELAPDFGPQVDTRQNSGNSIDSVAAVSTPNDTSLTEVERRHIESVLNQANWMIEGERGAAKILNLSPSTLRSRMQKLGIRRPVRSS
jgi:transcriptional regulator with GAF, ATPase, and Fis domain